MKRIRLKTDGKADYFLYSFSNTRTLLFIFSLHSSNILLIPYFKQHKTSEYM